MEKKALGALPARFDQDNSKVYGDILISGPIAGELILNSGIVTAFDPPESAYSQQQLWKIMMTEGLNLMLYGMGTVFVFLTLLVGCTLVMSAVVGRFVPAEQPATDNRTHTGKFPDQRLISVIEAAIAQHRHK